MAQSAHLHWITSSRAYLVVGWRGGAEAPRELKSARRSGEGVGYGDIVGKAFYRRRLPHWHPTGKPLFLTWRLHGSLPAGRTFPGSGEFEAFDRLLDGMSSGPLYLRMPEIAEIVAREVLRLEEVMVSNWVIMPNHVHLLAQAVSEDDTDWARSLKLIKGRSARAANLVLGRTGQPFWQEESFDRWVRSQNEFARIQRYIEANPVTAGLADSAERFRWSSAWREPNL